MIIRFRYCFVNFPYLCKTKLFNLVKKELLSVFMIVTRKNGKQRNIYSGHTELFMKIPSASMVNIPSLPNPPILPHPDPQLIVK